MVKFKLINCVFKDLLDIWNYMLDVWLENQVDKYYQMIFKVCIFIVGNLLKGKSYEDIYLLLKGKKVLKYIIFYWVLDDYLIEVI